MHELWISTGIIMLLCWCLGDRKGIVRQFLNWDMICPNQQCGEWKSEFKRISGLPEWRMSQNLMDVDQHKSADFGAFSNVR